MNVCKQVVNNFDGYRNNNIADDFKANNGQARVGFLINRKWKYNIVR